MNCVEEIRSLFPALKQKVYGKPLIYFDNAATSHKPVSVIELQNRMSSGINANIHRAVHKLSSDATDLYEKGREEVRLFLGAENREEIIFTSGTTASINLLAYTFVPHFMKKGDIIIISEEEHHSNIVPWQLACDKIGAKLSILPVDENGILCVNKLEGMLSDKVKLIAVAHISNVLGIINPVKKVIEISHSHGIPVLIDGAQGIVHTNFSVKELDCDFYVFSGHKIYAPTGIGVLYGKKKLLEQLPPYMGGGDMVNTVTFKKTTYADLPLKFEAGTPNFIGASCFAPALKFASQVRENSLFQEYERNLVLFLFEELNKIEGLKILGTPKKIEEKIALFSFTVEGVHPTDIAQIVDKMGVAVRSGLMCAEPLIRRFSDTGILRASLSPYNTMEEAEQFIISLKRAILMLRG
ncbi:MAG: SufS family cysteine desulfurase [Bacteroidales bacterium]|nr:SufS family cysteine desulfurase [Bacteroidales bacterium]